MGRATPAQPGAIALRLTCRPVEGVMCSLTGLPVSRKWSRCFQCAGADLRKALNQLVADQGHVAWLVELGRFVGG